MLGHSSMASDAAFFEVLEVDLRALSAEARKTDSLATQITGWLQHTDFPQIKESAERAVLKLRAISHEGRGVEAVRTQVRQMAPSLAASLQWRLAVGTQQHFLYVLPEGGAAVHAIRIPASSTSHCAHLPIHTAGNPAALPAGV